MNTGVDTYKKIPENYVLILGEREIVTVTRIERTLNRQIDLGSKDINY